MKGLYEIPYLSLLDANLMENQLSEHIAADKPAFLSGGGRMGQMIGVFDWSQTSLGQIHNWPQSLQTALSLVLNSKVPMLLFSGAPRQCFYNDACCEILGMDHGPASAPNEQLQKTWPAFWKLLEPDVEKVGNTKQAIIRDNQLIPGNGQAVQDEFCCNISYSPVHITNDQPIAVLVTVYVSGQRNSEQDNTVAENLAYRKALLEAQNEAIPDAILVVDTHGKMLSYNSHFGKLWNIPQEIIDRRDDTAALAFAMTQVSDPQKFIDRVNFCYAHPELKAYEEIDFKDGRTIERYGNAVTGEDGKSYGWIWYFRDITKQKQASDILRSSEDRYQNFIRQSTEGIWRIEVEVPIAIELGTNEQIDLLFQFAYLAECNKAMAQMYGYDDAGEMVGMRLSQLFPRDDDSHAYLSYFINSGYRVEDAESKELDRHGETVYFMNNLVGIVEEGKVIRAWGTQRNISNQKQAELALKLSEYRLRSLANAMPQVVWIAEANGEVTYYNDRVLDFDGVKKLPDGNWSWQGMVHPDDLDPTAEAWQTAVVNRTQYQKEHRIKMKDGSYRWHLSRALPQKDENGTVLKWYGTATDIHEQKNFSRKLERQVAERTKELASLNLVLETKNEDLASASNFLNTVLDSSVELVVSLDTDLKYNYVNQRTLSFMGKSPEELIGKHIVDVNPGIANSNIHLLLLKALEGEPGHLEHPALQSQSDIVLETYVLPLKMEDKVTGVIILSRDITQMIRLAENLKQLNTDLARSNEDLQQFAHVASHDLKEPVRKIMTFGNRLQQAFGTDLPPLAKSYLSKMEASALRMYSMIDGVLLYSTLNALEQTKEDIDLNELVQSIESDLEVVISEKQATVKYDNLPVIEGSNILFYQLFYNLVNNALKFSNPINKPIIKIYTAPVSSEELLGRLVNTDREYLKICLQDNGIGFNDNESEKIFGTFTRLHSKDKYEGTGLGLSLCRKIVERHGGLIQAKGKEGDGAIFEVILPAR